MNNNLISEDGYVKLKSDVFDKFLPITRGKSYKVVHIVTNMITILTDDKKQMTFAIGMFESAEQEDSRLEEKFSTW